MDVFEAILKRRSVRTYVQKPVPKRKLEKVLEAARLAPSAVNYQPWRFIVVTDQSKKEKISEGQRWAGFLKDAPVVIVGCGDREASPKWHVIDVAIAMQNIVMAATAEGLGTCWIGSFDEKAVKRLLKIPAHMKVVALLTLGYPREKLDIKRQMIHLMHRRKELGQIVDYEEYQKKI
ncbi:MAG: nitroreductase family protein [Candidatus Hadarchaeota archaeon]